MTLALWEKGQDLRLAIIDKWVMACIGTGEQAIQISAKLLNGSFPDTNSVLLDSSKYQLLTVNPKTLSKGLQSLGKVEDRGVRLVSDGFTIKAIYRSTSGKNNEMITVENSVHVPCKLLDGKEPENEKPVLEMGVDVGYLKDGLNSIKSLGCTEPTIISWQNKLSPIQFNSSRVQDGHTVLEYTYITMPMRL